jgi:glycosyltransferase involved in cell wall biosynthesis
MADSPLVSVVLPVFNRQATVERAVRTVLRQTHQNVEVVVVDDGSTDATAQMVTGIGDPRVCLIRHSENRNASAARNTGIAAAKGDYVAFLDSDDEWLPQHLARRLQVLHLGEADGVFGSFYVSRGGRFHSRMCAPYQGSEPLVEYVLSGRGDARTSTFCFRSGAVRELGFDPDLRKHQDWDFAGRLAERFRVICDPEITVVLYEDEHDRMTTQLDHKATEEFIGRFASQLSAPVLARFYTLWAMRTLRLEGRSDNFKQYLALAEDHSWAADWRVRGAVWALSRRGIDNAMLRFHDWYLGWRVSIRRNTRPTEASRAPAR